MKIPLRCAFHDPGGMSDFFGTLTADLYPHQILITDAVTWSREKTPNFSYDLVEAKIAKFHEVIKFDYNIVETNNTGVPVIQGLRLRHKMKIIGINTGRVTNAETERKGRTMDKEKIVDWILLLMDRGIIKLPIKMTPGLYELKHELDNFGEKKKGGRVVREALTGHDDLISCLKLCVHFAKLKILKIPELGPGIPFNGVGLQIDNQNLFGTTRLDRAKKLANEIMKKKGTLFDTIDVKLPGQGKGRI